MILLHIDDDPPRAMSEFDRMMYGLHALKTRCGFEDLSMFGPDHLELVSVESSRYHPLALVYGVESYREACEMFGIEPRGVEAKAYGFLAQMPEGVTSVERINGVYVPRTRTLEIKQLDALWQAEFKDKWSIISLRR